MELILPQWGRSLPTIGALATTRPCGISLAPYGDWLGDGGLNLATHVGDQPERVLHNRAQLRRCIPADPVWLNQVHGVAVVDAAKVSSTTDADASFTTEPGVVCAVMSADCLPILFADAAGVAVGAAHAGWRGLAAGVIENTVARMCEAGATNLHAWLGAAIGPAQFEVGEDVLGTFLKMDPAAESAFHAIKGRPGKYLADINVLARQALGKAGVVNITGGQFCTVSDPQRFYSFRRDGVTGRMASMIWLR